MLTSKPRMVIRFQARSSISFKHVFLVSVLEATPNCIPLNYRCPIKISDRLRHVYLIPTPTPPISLIQCLSPDLDSMEIPESESPCQQPMMSPRQTQGQAPHLQLLMNQCLHQPGTTLYLVPRQHPESTASSLLEMDN